MALTSRAKVRASNAGNSICRCSVVDNMNDPPRATSAEDRDAFVVQFVKTAAAPCE